MTLPTLQHTYPGQTTPMPDLNAHHDPLNPTPLNEAIARQNGPAFEHIASHTTIASTQTAMLDFCQHHAAQNALITSHAQSQGRGQYERTFWSPPGGLYASFSVIAPHKNHTIAPVSLLMGLAIAHTLQAHTPCQPITLKWPNDLMAGPAKLGGILSEIAPSQDGQKMVVIGMGINIDLSAHTPPTRAKNQ